MLPENYEEKNQSYYCQKSFILPILVSIDASLFSFLVAIVSCLLFTILDRIFRTKQRNPIKLAGQGISTFACFLTATTKVKLLQDRMDTKLCLHPNLGFFFKFPNFLRSEVWSNSATREATRIPSFKSDRKSDLY